MQQIVSLITDYIVMMCHLLAIVVIVIGMSRGLWFYFKDAIIGHQVREAIQECRLEMGHAFSLGLGFLIGGSILNTVLAPTWNEIGQLAAIIAIRTTLNFFLVWDITNQSKTKEAMDMIKNWPWGRRQSDTNKASKICNSETVSEPEPVPEPEYADAVV